MKERKAGCDWARTIFVLPVKTLASSKCRLAPVLTRRERGLVTLTLLKGNLEVLASLDPSVNILVVTPDPAVGQLGKEFGARILLEKHAVGLDGAMAAAARWSIAAGFETQVMVAPDIACLDSDELVKFVTHSGSAPTLSIASAKDGGSNLVLLCPPDAITYRFGAFSARKMMKAAKSIDLDCRIFQLPRAALDIDTPEDLAAWIGGRCHQSGADE